MKLAMPNPWGITSAHKCIGEEFSFQKMMSMVAVSAESDEANVRVYSLPVLLIILCNYVVLGRMSQKGHKGNHPHQPAKTLPIEMAT